MADVAVVGGGIAGAAVAFAVARRGAKVTVVDDSRLGRATAAGAGIIAPWATSLTGDVYRLYAAGAEAYPAILEALAELGIDDVGYTRNGALVLLGGDSQADRIVAQLSERTASSAVAGPPELVDSTEARDLFPPLGDGHGGVHIPGGARVDGRRLAAGLLDGVRRLGGEVVDGVATLDRSAVMVDDRRVDADATVVAAGAWMNDLLADTPVPVAAQRGQICHLQLEGVETAPWPSVLPPSDHYIVPFENGRVAVGATREPGVDDVRVTADGVSRVLAQALALAPGLGDATLTETRVGLRPFPTADHRPTIGRIETGRDRETWVVAGFGAIGLTIGPTVGERVAAGLLDGLHDELIDPFRPH